MTEKEVFDLQEQGGNQEYFLILVGSFLHAYGHGAFALSRADGCRRGLQKNTDTRVSGHVAPCCAELKFPDF